MQITKNALTGLVQTSPMFLFVSMILSFILMFTVQLFYYSELFEGTVPTAFAYAIGFAIGLMIQFARFAFGIAGASEFIEGNTGKGIAGIIFSLGLTIFESFEVAEIVKVWSEPNLQNSAMMILQSIVWLGFILEIRLAINVSGKLKKDNGIILNKSTTKKSLNGVGNGIVKTVN